MLFNCNWRERAGEKRGGREGGGRGREHRDTGATEREKCGRGERGGSEEEQTSARADSWPSEQETLTVGADTTMCSMPYYDSHMTRWC